MHCGLDGGVQVSAEAVFLILRSLTFSNPCRLVSLRDESGLTMCRLRNVPARCDVERWRCVRVRCGVGETQDGTGGGWTIIEGMVGMGWWGIVRRECPLLLPACEQEVEDVS